MPEKGDCAIFFMQPSFSVPTIRPTKNLLQLSRVPRITLTVHPNSTLALLRKWNFCNHFSGPPSWNVPFFSRHAHLHILQGHEFYNAQKKNYIFLHSCFEELKPRTKKWFLPYLCVKRASFNKDTGTSKHEHNVLLLPKTVPGTLLDGMGQHWPRLLDGTIFREKCNAPLVKAPKGTLSYTLIETISEAVCRDQQKHKLW